MRYTNLLHLSDLHLKKDGVGGFNQATLLGGLEADLRYVRDTQLRPDIIVFSGDLVQSADDEDIWSEIEKALSKIAEAAGLNLDRVFLCPGNHDASRLAVGPNLPLVRMFRDSVKDEDTLNSLYSNQGVVLHVGKVFSSFHRMQVRFGAPYLTHSDAYLSQYYLRDLRLSLILINTAFLTGAGLAQEFADERQLAFPEMALVNALNRVPAGSDAVVVGHHPLSHLSEVAEGSLKPHVLKRADLYLSGHLHAATPVRIEAPQGACAFVQSGALYASRKWWNGYAIVSVVAGSQHHRVTYRRWHEQRGAFGLASEFNDEGTVYTTSDGRTFWSSITPRVDLRALEKWRIENLLPFLAEEFSTGTDEADKLVFVEPEFERDVYVQTDNGLERTGAPEIVKLDELRRSRENLVIAAPSESGKTTLIRQWALSIAGLSALLNEWSVPAVLRFSELKTFLKGVEGLVKQRVGSLPLDIKVVDLLDAGMLTIFVDDAELRNSKAKSAFDEFVSKYPSCRYVLLTSDVYFQGVGIAPVVVKDVPFTHVRIRQLRTSQLLELIESHGTKDPVQADRLLQRMVREAASLNVPITPVTGTFLIQIYTEDTSQPLINRANLVERYVEISLEKFAPQELLPSTFDYHNKSDLLSFIASRMCKASIYDVEEVTFVAWIDEYLREYGLRFSSIDLLEYFVKARILVRFGGLISFRLNAFEEYFAASRMNNDSEFREFILDENRYLSFTNEISFYAAISRKDRAWLEELYRRFEVTSEQVWAEASAAVRDATMFADFALPAKSAKESDIFALEESVFQGELTEEERREYLDHDAPCEVSDGRIVQKQSIYDPGEAWISQLTLLSSMLKNMELIPSKVKSAILERVIHGWLQFLCLSMGIVPALAKEKRLRLNGIEYVILYPEDLEISEVARRLYLYMPISVAKIATHHLGTEKLRVQLEDGIGASTDVVPIGQQFLRSAVLAQLGVERLSEVVGAAAFRIRSRRYLSDVYVRLLAEIAVRYRLPADELQKVRQLAAEMRAEVEGSSGQRAARRRSEIVESLNHARLRLQLSRRHEA